jgi:hypothetical protein
MSQLTAGQECQIAGKILGEFLERVPGEYVKACLGVGIFREGQGVAVIKLQDGGTYPGCFL